jgi:hypothetical protein
VGQERVASVDENVSEAVLGDDSMGVAHHVLG